MRAVRVILVALAAILAFPAAADAKVKKVSLTSPVQAGGRARLVVAVNPRSRCSISIKGLGPRTGSRVTWNWQIPKDAKIGSTPIRVNCGKAGNLTTQITVRAASNDPLLGPARLAVCNQVVGRIAKKYGVQQVIPAEDFFAGRTNAAEIVASQSYCFKPIASS